MRRFGIKRLVPVERIELPTFGLQNRCSTAELNRPSHASDRRMGWCRAPQAAAPGQTRAVKYQSCRRTATWRLRPFGGAGVWLPMATGVGLDGEVVPGCPAICGPSSLSDLTHYRDI